MWPWSQYQPTTLLRFTTFFAFVGTAALLIWLDALPLWGIGIVVVIYLALVETGLLAWCLAIWAAKRQRDPSQRSVWFRDRDLEADRRLSKALEDTRDQPWLR